LQRRRVVGTSSTERVSFRQVNKLELFEKRFQVFQELTRTIAAAFQRVNVQISDLASFDAATEKARYLFGADCESR
jgi:hypothetical protein